MGHTNRVAQSPALRPIIAIGRCRELLQSSVQFLPLRLHVRIYLASRQGVWRGKHTEALILVHVLGEAWHRAIVLRDERTQALG